MIVTDEAGRPFTKPERADYPALVDYVRAVHEHNDRITAAANVAFDLGWTQAMARRVPISLSNKILS